MNELKEKNTLSGTHDSNSYIVSQKMQDSYHKIYHI